MLILSKMVYRERLYYNAFPILPSDTLTLALALDGHTVDIVKDIVEKDHKSFPNGDAILELVHGLPDMLDPTQEREREQQ